MSPNDFGLGLYGLSIESLDLSHAMILQGGNWSSMTFLMPWYYFSISHLLICGFVLRRPDSIGTTNGMDLLCFRKQISTKQLNAYLEHANFATILELIWNTGPLPYFFLYTEQYNFRTNTRTIARANTWSLWTLGTSAYGWETIWISANWQF